MPSVQALKMQLAQADSVNRGMRPEHPKFCAHQRQICRPDQADQLLECRTSRRRPCIESNAALHGITRSATRACSGTSGHLPRHH